MASLRDHDQLAADVPRGDLFERLFCLVQLQLSLLPFRVLRWPRADAVAIGIEVTMRNINLALLLWEVLFPGSDNPLAKGVGFVHPHPAQRWARQALFFLVWSCPRPAAEATLGYLTCAEL